ncbi:MAG TPA: hypothetical protein VKD28_16120 [Gemmatimonadales bacterium]|nr:hypothetical protein [Gemmatimonadales bacterium]
MMSRLPDDPGYWERLTDRIVTNAGSSLMAYRRAMSPRWHGLARYSIPLAIGAAAVLVLALLWRPNALRTAQQNALPSTIYGLMPSDPLAAQFIAATAPPTIATLLFPLTLERTP